MSAEARPTTFCFDEAMPKRTLEVVTFAAAAVLALGDNSRSGPSQHKLIGEVISEVSAGVLAVVDPPALIIFVGLTRRR